MPSSFFTLLNRSLFIAALFATSLAAKAEPQKSLLPAFGPEGTEVTVKAKGGHVVHGWLPKDWDDNTEWAPVTATYSKLDESPGKTGVALRIKLEKMDDGVLQLTSYAGTQTYQPGRIYRISGWVRSADHAEISVGARQIEDPYEMYHQQDLAADSTWKQFEFEFTPKKSVKAIIMFTLKNVSTVDLAGIVLTDEGSAK